MKLNICDHALDRMVQRLRKYTLWELVELAEKAITEGKRKGDYNRFDYKGITFIIYGTKSKKEGYPKLISLWPN